MTSPSEQIRKDDFSVANKLPIDERGAHKTFRNLQTDLYDIIKEVMQNGFDSKNRGLENRIEILINPKAQEGEPWLTVTDHGDGITKDYGGNLQEFIEARKATSEKAKRDDAMGYKGIGMMQYHKLGRKIIITSMEPPNQRGPPMMIYRIPYFVTDDGFTAFGKYESKPAYQNYQEEFGLNHAGTKVAFFALESGKEPIEEKALRKTLREQYTVFLAEFPNTAVYINGQKLDLPKWIKDHPPKLIQRATGGHDIRGAIWPDSNEEGKIRIYKDGQFVMEHIFDSRQCTGYFNINNCFVDNR